MGKITIVGLGPSTEELITQRTWQIMNNAKALYLRTKVHPAAMGLEKAGIKYETFDDFYESAPSFDAVYERICMVLCERAQKSDIVYAVPGSPLVAERTVVMLRQKQKAGEVQLQIEPAMSFLDLVYNRLSLDPIQGLLITDAFAVRRALPNLANGTIITQVYDREMASEVKLTLNEALGDDFEIVLLNRLGLLEERVVSLPLYELDRQKDIDYLTSIYVPPAKNCSGRLEALEEILAKLRSENGCPWDREQTSLSLRNKLLEEAYEVIEAIDLEDAELLQEELGDLLLHIAFQARIAQEQGDFAMHDVVRGICEKLIRRHPHVFGNASAKTSQEVADNWEKIKKAEKKERQSALDGIPKDLPALMRAQKMQKKAAAVGFDFHSLPEAWKKFEEEKDELKEAVQAGESEHIKEEYGDLLFSLVNVGRFLKLDCEQTLREAAQKFLRRFLYVEARVKASKKRWSEFSLAQLDEFWLAAKQYENNENQNRK